LHQLSFDRNRVIALGRPRVLGALADVEGHAVRLLHCSFLSRLPSDIRASPGLRWPYCSWSSHLILRIEPPVSSRSARATISITSGSSLPRSCCATES